MASQQAHLHWNIKGFLLDTKTNIEAVAEAVEGYIGYATDTNEFGTYDGATWTWGSGSSGHIIKNQGTPLTARAGLNFVGHAVEATDDSGGDETDVTVYAPRLYSFATAPTINDDTLDGYVEGDIWIDTVTANAYILTDDAGGAAVWRLILVNLDDLGDVEIGAAVPLADKHIFVYETTYGKWINRPNTASRVVFTPSGNLTSTGVQDAIVELRDDTLGSVVDGTMINGKIVPTVSANDLIVSLKTKAGTDPTSDSPVYIMINGTLRGVTSALSITLADATNWFGSGSAELAAKEVDYFVYAIWDSNSSAVAIAPARIPFGRLVSDFSSTTTNEKYLGGYSNYTTTDDVCVIGRFAATLSAAAGHVWTVPTFTNLNLIQHPIFETRLLDWTPQHTRSTTDYTNDPTNFVAKYQLHDRRMHFSERHRQHATTPGGAGWQQVSLPFTSVLSSYDTLSGFNESSAAIMSCWVDPTAAYFRIATAAGAAEATANAFYDSHGYYFIG